MLTFLCSVFTVTVQQPPHCIDEENEEKSRKVSSQGPRARQKCYYNQGPSVGFNTQQENSVMVRQLIRRLVKLISWHLSNQLPTNASMLKIFQGPSRLKISLWLHLLKNFFMLWRIPNRHVKRGKTTARLFIPFSFYNYRMSQLSCYNLAERQPFLLASSKQSGKRPTTKTHEKRVTQDTQNGVPQVNCSSVCLELEAPSLLFIQLYSSSFQLSAHFLSSPLENRI